MSNEQAHSSINLRVPYGLKDANHKELPIKSLRVCLSPFPLLKLFSTRYSKRAPLHSAHLSAHTHTVQILKLEVSLGLSTESLDRLTD